MNTLRQCFTFKLEITALVGKGGMGETSCSAGFAPLSDLEKVVLEVERTVPSHRLPVVLVGHGADDFAQTLRTATIGWLASLVAKHAAALNVFDLWLKIFPERRENIIRVRDEIRPHLQALTAFRSTTAFHANKSVTAPQSAPGDSKPRNERSNASGLPGSLH